MPVFVTSGWVEVGQPKFFSGLMGGLLGSMQNFKSLSQLVLVVGRNGLTQLSNVIIVSCILCIMELHVISFSRTWLVEVLTDILVGIWLSGSVYSHLSFITHK